MSLIESWFPQATQPTRSADSWAGKPPGSVPKGSAQEAALKDPGGFRKQLQMVEVQTGAPTEARPEGTWAWRLQHPDHPGQFYNFQPNERLEKGKAADLGDVSDRALQADKRGEHQAVETNRGLREVRTLQAEDRARARRLEERQQTMQERQQTMAENQQSWQQGRALVEDKRYADETARRDRRDAVMDQRYLDEIAQRNKLTEYGFQVAAYNARAQRRGDLFNFIGNALRGLMA